MSLNDDEKIIQIIPADGWYVKFISNEHPDEPATIEPVACFALIAVEDGSRYVRPMYVPDGASLDFADQNYSTKDFTVKVSKLDFINEPNCSKNVDSLNFHAIN